MFEGAFDIVVMSFRADSPEPLEAVLERLLDVSQAEARRLSARLPSTVRSDVPYVKAEALCASLTLAGAEVAMRKAQARTAEQSRTSVDALAVTLAGKAANALMQGRIQPVPNGQHALSHRSVPPVAPPSVLASVNQAPANDVVPVSPAVELDFALRPTEEPMQPRKERGSLLSILARKLGSRELKIPTLPPPTPIEPEAPPLYTKEQLELEPLFPGQYAKFSNAGFEIPTARAFEDHQTPAAPAAKRSAPRLPTPAARASEMRMTAPGPLVANTETQGAAREARGWWEFGRAKAKPPKSAYRPFTFSGGEVEQLNSRMVWLLAILWLSVALLLWYHDIL